MEGLRPLPSHYDRCFGCGERQLHGLHLSMSGAGERVAGSFVVTEHHQGAPGLAHGGVIAAAVDEGMGFLLWLLATPAVTAHLEIDFRAPLPVGSRLELEGALERVEGRKIFARMTGTVEGRLVVEARALFLKVGVEHFVPYVDRADGTVTERPYNP